MKVIICLDVQGGMMFNSRRQSQDLKVKEDIIKIALNEGVMMNEDTYHIFKGVENASAILVGETPSKDCEMYQFIEHSSLEDYQSDIEDLIVYDWNRMYPSDLKCKINFDVFDMVTLTEFKGVSHDCITKKEYKKKKEK